MSDGPLPPPDPREAWDIERKRQKEEPEDPRIAQAEWEREHGDDPDEADHQAEREADYWRNVGWGNA